MDRIRMAAGLLVLGGTVQACAPPPVPPPVCGDAGVLRQVAESLRARGQAMVLEAPPVGEVSSAPGSPSVPPTMPPLAHCAVRGHITGYDTNRYGASPVYDLFTVNYTVEMRHNGVFVSIE